MAPDNARGGLPGGLVVTAGVADGILFHSSARPAVHRMAHGDKAWRIREGLLSGIL